MILGGIPKGGELLPFVNEMWLGTGKGNVDVECDTFARGEVVRRIGNHVGAGGLMKGGPRLSTPFWAFNADCSKRFQIV